MIVDGHGRCMNGVVGKSRWYEMEERMTGRLSKVEVFRGVRRSKYRWKKEIEKGLFEWGSKMAKKSTLD